jgi:hypothetical protein
MRDNSIANLLISFQPSVGSYTTAGTGIAKYYLKDDGSGNATGTGLSVTNDGNTITVITGPLKFIVNKTAFNIIDQLWLDKNSNGIFESSEQLISSNYGMYFVVVRPLDSSIVNKADLHLPEWLTEGLTAYPNPFNPAVRIMVQCRSGHEDLKVSIYNPSGRKVGTLSPVNKTYRGQNMRLEYVWNAKDQASGVFVMSAKANGKTWQKRVLLVR